MDGENVEVFEGNVSGTIVYPPRAQTRGFGWDCVMCISNYCCSRFKIFAPEGFSTTLSEMMDHKFVVHLFDVHFNTLKVNMRNKPFLQLSYTNFEKVKQQQEQQQAGNQLERANSCSSFLIAASSV